MKWIQPYVPLMTTNATLLEPKTKVFPDMPDEETIYYDDGKWHLSTPEFWEIIEKKYPTQRMD